jgi:hypothetical protein
MNFDERDFNYPYVGVPLTPSIIEDLVTDIFAGKIVSRAILVDELVKHHLKNGGAKGKAQDVSSVIKKALANLKRKGKAENPSVGHWRIGEISMMDKSDETQIPKLTTMSDDQIADSVLGEGGSVVYLYYLPTYRQIAVGNNENAWYCKIGKTDRDPLIRIMNQVATALPEKPHIALLIRTNMPNQLEVAIHSILTLRGRKIDSSPGSEWFLTNPSEVQEIYKMILS